MKLNKKLISVIIVISVISSVFALSAFNAFAKTQELILNTKITAVIDGVDDLAWFIYTPQESGTYSFLSYNDYASEGYLFIKEVDTETWTKTYKQLAYATNDPNYAQNGHNFRQFCLTYHLEQGVTYYFAAGWFLSEDRTNGNMNVMLRCDSFDSDIAYITAQCDAQLEAYEDGNYATDGNGDSYFQYDISRIIANTTVTIYYNDNSSSSVTGAYEINGYSISYNHNQYEEHWYPQDYELYTNNRLTVGVLGKSCDMDVKITTNGRYKVEGRVVDTLANAVENARVINNSQSVVATTDENGAFSFYSTSGRKDFTIEANGAISRSVVIYVTVDANDNNYASTPIELCKYDLNNDRIVNAKDFAIINRNESISLSDDIKADFARHINFTSNNYDNLILKNG